MIESPRIGGIQITTYRLKPGTLQKEKSMNLLKRGDTIGIISPSWVANQNDCEKYAKGIEKLGFHVKFGKNIYKDTYKYTASVTERIDDLNEMIYDENVIIVTILVMAPIMQFFRLAEGRF